MMLRRPGNAEAGSVGHLHHFQGMPRNILHIDAVVHAFKVYS
jgi:hypothetical protein